jgi:hypothetical protein
MSDNIIPLSGLTTKLDIPADAVLGGATGKLADAVLIGWDKEGEFYVASSLASGAETLLLLEKAKQRLMEML